MAKRKLPMNEAELERYRDNIELKQVRGEIRNHFATEKGPVPIILTSRLAELKFKRKFLGLHARSVAVGEAPWQ